MAFFGNAFLEIPSETVNILSLRLFFRDHQNNVSMYFDCFEEKKTVPSTHIRVQQVVFTLQHSIQDVII